MRTPLATLVVSLEILAEWRELRAGEIDELIGRLGRGVSWLDRLVENLSAWSAVETAGLTLRRAPAPVLDWITPALALVRPLLDGRDQAVELICVGEPAWVDGDAMRLSQALVNLLVNASKYSVWGDRLAVTVTTDEAWVRVAVTDHGDGVPAEEGARIFKRRARGLAALHSGERGQGIGLDVVSGVVEAHGGTVGVESAYGRGATFWFTLPWCREGGRVVSIRRGRRMNPAFPTGGHKSYDPPPGRPPSRRTHSGSARVIDPPGVGGTRLTDSHPTRSSPDPTPGSFCLHSQSRWGDTII